MGEHIADALPEKISKIVLHLLYLIRSHAVAVDLPVIDHDDPLVEVVHQIPLVGHHHHGGAKGVDALQQGHDLQRAVGIQIAGAGENVPDVILYQTTTGENASLALNGALVPISDYSDWTPNFNARVEEMGLQDDVDMLNLQDGKRYYMPSLTDKPFYDGGLILREDYLESKGLEAPKTFDDLYEILKAYKADYPDSYPLTILAGPRVLFRMTMPSFGISVGKNSADGSYVLSYDYDNKDFFAGAIDDKCKEYFAFLNKLYAEGLLDPEMADPIDGDKWSQKMATGSSMATYAYYDQIGGVEAASEIDGFKLQMYAPLEGPAGAHHQPKSRTGSGIMFPKKTAERDDFERIVRTIDEMFYSEENAKLWCLGVEGVTYTMDGDKIVYSDDIVNSADGIYKSMQLKYGCGSDVTQMVCPYYPHKFSKALSSRPD